MATIDNVFIGTELKLNVHIDQIGELTMDDYNFEFDIYCSPKNTINIKKGDAIRIDQDNYVILVDTNAVGAGALKVKIVMEIPDADFDDEMRTEVEIIDTKINIVKSL